jgi:hypothetical protein
LVWTNFGGLPAPNADWVGVGRGGFADGGIELDESQPQRRAKNPNQRAADTSFGDAGFMKWVPKWGIRV